MEEKIKSFSKGRVTPSKKEGREKKDCKSVDTEIVQQAQVSGDLRTLTYLYLGVVSEGQMIWGEGEYYFILHSSVLRLCFILVPPTSRMIFLWSQSHLDLWCKKGQFHQVFQMENYCVTAPHIPFFLAMLSWKYYRSGSKGTQRALQTTCNTSLLKPFTFKLKLSKM